MSKTTTTTAEDKAKTKAEEEQSALAAVASFLDEHPDIYYVANENRFNRYLPQNHEWVLNTEQALRTAEPERLRPFKHWSTLLTVMKHTGRMKEMKTYSFRKQPDNVLNMLRSDGFLKPVEGAVDPFFDYLMYALGGGKAENMLHIKQVIGWKYLHPEDWQLPCMCFFGRGGAGKNLLAEKIMGVIFGTHLVRKVGFHQIEKFNASCAGAAVVFMDEHPERSEVETLKRLVGSPFITIEQKGIDPFKAENTALYIIATNNPNGPFKVETNGSERRWSFLKVSHRLVDVVSADMSITEEEAKQAINLADKEIYGNPDEVAKFLHECIQEAQKLETTPLALHGEDFRDLLDQQLDAFDDLMRDVFIEDVNFQYISLPTLYEMYKERSKELNPSASSMSIQNFYGRVKEYIQNRSLTSVAPTDPKRRPNIRSHSRGMLRQNVFYSLNHFAEPPKSLDDNSTEYLSGMFMQKQLTSVKERNVAANIVMQKA